MYLSLVRRWQHISHRTAAVFTATTGRRHSHTNHRNGVNYFLITTNGIISSTGLLRNGVSSHVHTKICNFPRSYSNLLGPYPIRPSVSPVPCCSYSNLLGPYPIRPSVSPVPCCSYSNLLGPYPIRPSVSPVPCCSYSNLLGPYPIRPSVSPVLCCSYSRLVRNTSERKQKARLRMKTLQLIDEQGNNLGIMDTVTALQLASAKGLEIVQVKKELPDSNAVCKLVSKKQLWEDEKREKERKKKDPRNITKEITVSTTIGDHDLAVKVNHMRGFLEKTHNVKLCIETRFRRGVDYSAVREAQVVMLEKIVKELEGVGVKVGKEVFHRRRLVCSFKSLVGL